MASLKIRKGDTVKVIAGNHKGTQAKVIAVQPSAGTVTLEGIGEFERRLKPTQLNPRAGTKKAQRAMDVSKVMLVHDDAANKVTRVGFAIQKDGTKVRVAKQAQNKEIK